MNALSNVLPPNASAIAHTIAMPTRAGRVGTSRLSHAKAKTAAVPATVLFCHHSCARQSAQRCCPRAHARICACATRPAPARIAGSQWQAPLRPDLAVGDVGSEPTIASDFAIERARSLFTDPVEGRQTRVAGAECTHPVQPLARKQLAEYRTSLRGGREGARVNLGAPNASLRKPLHGSLRVQYSRWPRLCKRKPWKPNGERLHPRGLRTYYYWL